MNMRSWQGVVALAAAIIVAAMLPAAAVAAEDGQSPSTAIPVAVGVSFDVFLPKVPAGLPEPRMVYRLPHLRAGEDVVLHFQRNAFYEMRLIGPNADDASWQTEAMRIQRWCFCSSTSTAAVNEFRETLSVQQEGDYLVEFFPGNGSWADININVVVESISRPCIVPTLTKFHTNKNIAKKLTDAGCAIGATTYMSTPGYKVGGVIGLGTPAGTKLAAGAKVNVAIRGCVVPTIKAGSTVAATHKAITKAGCRIGATTKVKHRSVRAGRVIRAGRKAGVIVAPGAKVNLVISKGKR